MHEKYISWSKQSQLYPRTQPYNIRFQKPNFHRCLTLVGILITIDCQLTLYIPLGACWGACPDIGISLYGGGGTPYICPPAAALANCPCSGYCMGWGWVGYAGCWVGYPTPCFGYEPTKL